MADFICTLCGRCCMGMGKYVKIAGSMGPNQVVCRHELGKEIVYATIEKPYRDDYDPDEIPDGWCPFLRELEDSGKYACIIHATRPQFCRNYKCCTMKILDRDSKTVGMVKGKTSITTDDKILQEFWKGNISSVRYSNDMQWRKEVSVLLEDAGYIVEIYD